jgi:hypothetical protein
MFGRIERRATRNADNFQSGERLNLRIGVYGLYNIYISRHKTARFRHAHECLTKILNVNDSDDS